MQFSALAIYMFGAIFWAVGSASVFASEPVDVSQALSGITLDGKAEFYEDDHRRFTEPGPGLDAAPWRPLDRREIEQGLTRSVFWIRFRIANPSAAPRAWTLSHDLGLQDEMRIFVLEPHGRSEFLATDLVPFGQGRSHPHPLLNVADELPALAEATVYVKLSNKDLEQGSLSIRLWNEGAFEAHGNKYIAVNALLLGTALGVAVVMGAMAFVLRSMAPLIYATFVLVCVIALTGFSGVAFKYAFPDHHAIQQKITLIAVLLGGALSHFFCVSYLDMSLPRLVKIRSILLSFGFVYLVFAVAGPFMERKDSLVVASLTVFPMFSLNVLAGILVWQQTRKSYVFWFMLMWLLNAISLSSFALLAALGFDELSISQVSYTYEVVLVCDTALLAISFFKRFQDSVRQTVSIGRTGLAGARELELEMEFQRKSKRGRDFSLHALTIDQFNSITEIYGGSGGEEVMVHLTALTHRILPKWAVLYRVSHETLVVAVPLHLSQAAEVLVREIEQRFLAETTDFQGLSISHRLRTQHVVAERGRPVEDILAQLSGGGSEMAIG